MPTPPKILLQLRGLGPIVSFKNTKMILPAKGNRKAMLITAPEKQKAMESYSRAIESQLRSAFQTAAAETQTGHSLASWTASSVPLDDSIQWVPEIKVEAVTVPKGEEGADILIERLNP